MSPWPPIGALDAALVALAWVHGIFWGVYLVLKHHDLPARSLLPSFESEQEGMT
jgi:hypothetical protein